MTRAADVLSAARARGVMIATAESCTGGLVVRPPAARPGAADAGDRGLVPFGAVSEEIAREMAEGALARSNAALSVAVTGIAGPGGSDHKPEGRVCFGLARQGQPTQTETRDFGALGRAKVRAATVEHALALLLEALASP